MDNKTYLNVLIRYTIDNLKNIKENLNKTSEELGDIIQAIGDIETILQEGEFKWKG